MPTMDSTNVAIMVADAARTLRNRLRDSVTNHHPNKMVGTSPASRMSPLGTSSSMSAMTVPMRNSAELTNWAMPAATNSRMASTSLVCREMRRPEV